MSHWAPDYCFEQFKTHRATIASAINCNEDTTRLRAIDTMLIDVLGWDKLDIETEKHCRAVGFTDYALHTNSVVTMVVEAKRADEYFILPGVEISSRICSFGLLAVECPKADFALRQAASYAATLGSQYTAISNGYQWLASLTYIQSQPIQERRVLVFESLEAIEQNFRMFWDCLSPNGVATNRALPQFIDTRKAPPPVKPTALFQPLAPCHLG